MISVIVAMVPLTIPKLLGYRIYGIMTESMTPAYSVGGVVYVKDCEPKEVQPGDVITFYMGSNTEYVMTHRVIEKDEQQMTFTTKGDANNTADAEPVNFDRLIGKAAFFIPGIAGLAAFVNSTTGKAACFIVFAAAFMMWLLADMLSPKKAKKVSETEAVGTETKKTKKKSFNGVQLAGMVLVLGAGIYLGSIFWQYRQGTTEYDALNRQMFSDTEMQETDGMEETGISASDRQILQKLAELKEQNPEVIGWIKFDNFDLSYPVMQGEENTYYLKHTFSGEENAAGSIFMEAANTSDFNDCHTILYGHNMKNLSMFGSLRQYRQEDFYQDNQFFTIYTEQEVYRYQIFAYYDISQDAELYTIGFAPNEVFQSFVEDMKRRSYYDTGVDVSKMDKVLTLSTCSSKGNRFVVNAKRIEQ